MHLEIVLGSRLEMTLRIWVETVNLGWLGACWKDEQRRLCRAGNGDREQEDVGYRGFFSLGKYVQVVMDLFAATEVGEFPSLLS